MEQKNIFDLVVDYIDNNIKEKPSFIKEGIAKHTGCNIKRIEDLFSLLTNETLFHYIVGRKMFFAGNEIYNGTKKSICEIALEYGYSEQSAFSRTMKTFCKCTPNELKQQKHYIVGKKYKLANIADLNKTNNWDEKQMEKEKNKDIVEEHLIFKHNDVIIELAEKYGDGMFQPEITCKIIELAISLNISPWYLIGKCEEAVIETFTDTDYISWKDEICIELGIESSGLLDEICKYYECDYCDVDPFMVAEYKEEMF